ncbi:MAG: hypothetical protein GX785_18305 [Armatimonadetes bacterium]|nr:hypothetical protein [Armatimonadota bacterium]
MADKGKMIALRIDTGRIRTLAPIRAETVLVERGETAALVSPARDGYREVAEGLRGDLSRLTGVEWPPAVDGDEWQDSRGASDLIALGHAGNNRLLRRLHDLRYLADSDYPSEGARVVSIHNPFGDGRNVLAVLGRTREVCARGAEQLREVVTERDGRWLVEGRLLIQTPRPKTPDLDEMLRAGRAVRRARSGRPSAFLQALNCLNATGEERWARAFIELVTPYATGEILLSFWRMSAVDFWTDALATAWDCAEEFPFFTDEERLLVANFVASCTEYCHDALTYQKWRLAETEHQVFNHHTFPAIGLYFGTRYLRLHGYLLDTLDAWEEKALAIFARAAQAGRSFDEGGAGYSWLVGNHLLSVTLARGDETYVRSEKLKRYADLATVIQNNHFELVPFGDCGGYHTRGTGATSILLRAAEWHHHPGYKWLAERHAPEAAAADILAADVPAAPPAEHVGLFVLPLDPVIHRWTTLPRFPGYPLPNVLPNVPAAEGFDKLSLRGGWGPDDDYLLLQGFGDGQHGHPDANAISQYQVKGRLFLAESDYIRRMPKQHNMVMVIRDGAHAPIPVTARLDGAREFPWGAITQTSLLDYNGCDWQRTLIWLRGDCVLCVDALRARVAGDYELRCYWRTLGDAELTEQGLHAEHTGEHFHILARGEPERRLDIEPVPLNTTRYPEYRYGDPRPKVLQERLRVHLDAGEEACFVNLLLPNGEHAAPRRTLERPGAGQIRIGGEGPAVEVDLDGVQVAGHTRVTFPSGARLTALAAAPAAITGAACLPDTLAGPGRRIALPAPVTALTPLEDGAVLAGCADGSLLRVEASGKTVLLAKAGDRVGVVAAGRLWGEEELTLLAASYDATLRLLRPDGEPRLTVELPANGHMPAWGKAICLANLDGDGRLWPVAGTAAWRVHALLPDGGFRWTADTAAHATTCLARGDLNHDGRDEIVAGTVYFCVPAFTADGERLWQDEDYNDYWQAGPTFPFVAVADVDADGDLEVLTVGSDTLVHCISHLGEKKWTHSIGDEAAGLVVLPQGIVAASLTGDLHLIDGRGNRAWRRELGSPCTALTQAGHGVCVATEAGDLVWVDAASTPLSRWRLPAPAECLLGTHAAIWAGTRDGALCYLDLPPR